MKKTQEAEALFAKIATEEIDSVDVVESLGWENLEEIESLDELRDALEEAGAFDIEVIYYHNAMEYLVNNDASLQISIGIAMEYGYALESINSELLATLLASQNARENFDEFSSEVEELFK